jgi:hypothetical protein
VELEGVLVAHGRVLGLNTDVAQDVFGVDNVTLTRH